MKLTFLGAAGEVTGSCYLVEHAGVKFLLDCGMFQGGRDAERKNGRFVYRSDRYTGGRAGSGGPEIKLENLNGDIRVLESGS